MHTWRETLRTSLDQSGLEGLDYEIAQNVLEAMPDDRLESFSVLVQNQKLGWKFVVDNFRAKVGLIKKDADTKEWEELFAAEAKILEGIKE